MTKDVRWKQRFQNFEKAYLFLEEACAKETFDALQAAGLVQTFEFTFEMACKTLKDYMEQQGISTSFPREVIKQAFSHGLIEDGHLWIDMLDKRNELTHTYNEEQATHAIQLIQSNYFPAITQAYRMMQTKCSD